LDLTAILWIFVTAVAFVFAGDALISRGFRMRGAPSSLRGATLRFGLLMLLFALACSGVALYEVLT
jgi:hypothetical protein